MKCLCYLITYIINYRIERNTFNLLLHLIGPKLNNHPIVGREKIDPVKQLLVTIYILATPDSYRSVSERFGIAKSTAWISTKRVIRAIYSIRNQLIKWPTYEETRKTWTTIHRKHGFPKVLGAIDGTHINIAKPNQDSNSYINRKGKYSIQLQVSNKNMFCLLYILN